MPSVTIIQIDEAIQLQHNISNKGKGRSGNE